MAVRFTSRSLRKRRTTHTRAQAPVIALDQPGRLRVAHIMALFGWSHSTLYKRKNDKTFPKPDGYDGKIPYWKTETVRPLLYREDQKQRA